MRERKVARCRRGCVVVIAAAIVLFAPPTRAAVTFAEDLARVDRALKENPSGVSERALQACRTRRNDAARLYNAGHVERAERRLKHCIQDLRISDLEPQPVARPEPVAMEEVQASAARELERALALEPDVANGLRVYRDCAACHTPEGWGLSSGVVPQIAGQHRRVVIKQLADIRAGNRENPMMLPYASVEAIGGTQAVADVAGYIDTLEMTVENGKGPGDDLELGAKLYRENCARCHGASGEGDAAIFAPRIQSQHFGYLTRQFQAIQQGRRRNANPEMAAQIRDFDERETLAVVDYVSRLEPPEDLRAPPDWHNPDFAN